MQFTFTPAELRQLLEQALSNYRACESVYDFSPDALINTVERTLEGVTVAQADMDKRLENSLPYLDEVIEWTAGSDEPDFELATDIPFDGSGEGTFILTDGKAVFLANDGYVELEDNISPEAIGLESPF